MSKFLSDRPYSEHSKDSSTWAGCLIPVIITTIAAGVIAWGVWTLFQQDKAIAGFTSPVPLEITPSNPSASETAALRDRLKTFAGEPPRELRLNTTDLNHLIASTPELKDLKPIIHVDSIDGDGVRCTISFPMRSLGHGPRYLNGSLTALPVVEEREFYLKTPSIDVPGKEVPQGFVTGYSQDQYLDSLFLHPFKENPGVWNTITSITSVSIDTATQSVILKRGTAPAPAGGR